VVPRHFRFLIHALVAAQIFLSAPVVAAMTSPAGTTTGTSMSGMPCDDFMPATLDGEPCPCCPDGVDSAAACLSACAASVGATSEQLLPLVIVTSTAAFAPVNVPVACAAEPPLKPPPIR
jgi:hypothetical protein